MIAGPATRPADVDPGAVRGLINDGQGWGRGRSLRTWFRRWRLAGEECVVEVSGEGDDLRFRGDAQLGQMAVAGEGDLRIG